jgi:single-strand DNA-binding protein
MMADVSNWTGTGRLVRDAEKKTLNTGTEMITFDIAVNTGWGEREKVAYLKIQLWGKAGPGLFQYLTKGKMVGIAGELEVQRWTSKQDGSQQTKVAINTNAVVLYGGGKSVDEAPKASRNEPEDAEYSYEDDIDF